MLIEADDVRSQRVDAAIADYLDALKQGDPPSADAFLAQHAEIASELKAFLDDHLAVNDAAYRAVNDISTDGDANSTGRSATAATQPLAGPRQFGAFTLLEEVARGGMGVVYKAQQATPSRIVALKMILAGQLASKADVDRFYAEAHAAAALDHPHIVPIFEVGEHDGHHYYTMAFVEGRSLAQRLAEGPLPAQEAAPIIREAAHALQYAHQHGVIHRDLKPANILLDADGRIRVTDFGLAKRQTEVTGLTRTGELLGTPSFMSPEQIAGDPRQITPASDVYALGATLYALLTGRPPFQAASIVETLKQVTDAEAVPPRQLNAAVPRDLETIVLKCLEKTPARRYPTAQTLADELDRFLSGRPIEARPVGSAEHAWRWCKRNPAVAGLAAAVVAALVAGTAVSSYFAASARKEANATRVALGEARSQRKIAEGVNEFFSGQVFFLAAPHSAEHSNLSLLDAIDLAAEKIDDNFPDDLELRAVLHDKLGSIYWGNDQKEKAVTQFEKSAALYEQLAGPSDHRTLAARSYLAGVLPPTDPRTRQILEEVLAAQTKSFGATNIETLDTATRLGNVLQQIHDPHDIEFDQENFERCREALGADNPITLEAEYTLSWALRWKGQRLDDSLKYAEEAAIGLRKAKTADDNHAMGASYNYACALQQAGRLDDAAEELKNLLEVRSRVSGPAHTNTLGTAWRLVTVLRGLNRTDEAIAMLKELSPKVDDGRNKSFTMLASCWADAGDNDAAVLWTQKSVDLQPEDSVLHATAARMRVTAGDLEGYRKSCAAMLKQFENSKNPKDRFWLAWTCGLAPDALPDLAPLIHRTRKLAEENPNYPQDLAALGNLLYRTHQYDEAAESLNKCLEVAAHVPNGVDVAACPRFIVAMIDWQQGRKDEARAALEEATTKMYEVERGTPSWDRRRTFDVFLNEANALIAEK